MPSQKNRNRQDRQPTEAPQTGPQVEPTTAGTEPAKPDSNPPAFDWDSMLADDAVEVVDATVTTKTEDDINAKLRALVDASYKDGKYRRIKQPSEEAANELLKQIRLYAQVRKAGQLTIRTSATASPEIVQFKAKDKESRPRKENGDDDKNGADNKEEGKQENAS